MSGQKIEVAVVGATGYAGGELLRILATHPSVNVKFAVARAEAGKPVTDMYPHLRGFLDGLSFVAMDVETLKTCDVVFFATPHGVAMSVAKELLASDTRIIDLAADFRLKDIDMFKAWYKMDHACPDILSEAVYGQPETMRDKMKGAKVFGMAGCYPTSIELGLLPLMEYEKSHPGTFDLTTMIADSKSGISGAGKKADVSLLMSEMNDNFHAYGVKGHRHQPEIVQQLKLLSGSNDVRLTFVPHLLPTIRGIHSTIYVRLKNPEIQIYLLTLYEKSFVDEYFVDVLPQGSHPETRSVRGSNFARIAVHRPQGGDWIVVLVVEDNLVKGAAGQAVQAMNLMFELPENEGLDRPALMP